MIVFAVCCLLLVRFAIFRFRKFRPEAKILPIFSARGASFRGASPCTGLGGVLFIGNTRTRNHAGSNLAAVDFAVDIALESPSPLASLGQVRSFMHPGLEACGCTGGEK